MNEEELKKIYEQKLAEERLRVQLRKILDDKAYERMMNIKNIEAKKGLYHSAAQTCIQLFQRVGRKITENEVIMILKSLSGFKKESKIEIRRK